MTIQAYVKKAEIMISDGRDINAAIQLLKGRRKESFVRSYFKLSIQSALVELDLLRNTSKEGQLLGKTRR